MVRDGGGRRKRLVGVRNRMMKRIGIGQMVKVRAGGNGRLIGSGVGGSRMKVGLGRIGRRVGWTRELKRKRLKG